MVSGTIESFDHAAVVIGARALARFNVIGLDGVEAA
jgi:hypothetical protein